MRIIDGSEGEGGGQVLRSALALSAVTGTPFRIERIRANRRRPGLARQHLTAVRAAAEVCGARVQGDEMRSTELVFEPGPVRPGEYRFAVGSAGSANLVLQTVLPPLMVADGPSLVTVSGGTHNENSPPLHFLQRTFLPLLARMGPRVELELRRWGFFPAGGGELVAAVEPARLAPLELVDRGEVTAIRPVAVVSLLPRRIGYRELDGVARALGVGRRHGEVVEVEEPAGPGNVLMIEVVCEQVTETFTGFGRKGVRAEAVAEEAAAEAKQWLESGAPVGAHLADQLLLPLALAGGGRFRTVEPTLHTTTNAQVVQRFLSVAIRIEQVQARVWEVEVTRG